MSTPNTPIVNAGVLYINGFGISRGTTISLVASPGAARDSTNTNDIISNGFITAFGNIVGTNGCDVATFVPSRFYAVYIIGDSNLYNPTALLFSLNNVSPVMPHGYDMFRRIGWILTDGSSEIRVFHQYGSSNDRIYYYDAGIIALTAGNAIAFTAVDLFTSVPPIQTAVTFDVSYTPTAAANIAEFNPFGSTLTAGIVRFGYGVVAAQRGPVTVPASLNGLSPTILYKVTAVGNSLTLLTTSYEDFL